MCQKREEIALKDEVCLPNQALKRKCASALLWVFISNIGPSSLRPFVTSQSEQMAVGYHDHTDISGLEDDHDSTTVHIGTVVWPPFSTACADQGLALCPSNLEGSTLSNGGGFPNLGGSVRTLG